ncbi:PilC/PilY family type IV pilus protein [Endozoicomonas atrinae]|uniref:PilC/PilY family type IV pilus protein n=1 Tax=Endozoicomonas atrinae TaxID=1333660 RepID=UPI0015866AD5
MMLLFWQPYALADDTEVFTGGNVGNNERPQVMIIFDNSGSMKENVSRGSYNPDVIYPVQVKNANNGTYYSDPNRYYRKPENVTYVDDYCKTIKKENEDEVERCLGNYINWRIAPTKKLDIAKQAITSLINDNNNIDFGLAVFNRNEFSEDVYGGHILRGVMERDATGTQSLVQTINNIDAETWTPLCDTFYEVYRYFTSNELYFAKSVSSRDTSQDEGGRYITPIKSCQNIYVIYMTDGEPTKDGGSNSKIKQLTGKSSCKEYGGNCLPLLSEYMANLEVGGLDGDQWTGNQKAFTYTIGFDTDQSLLFDTAKNGDGICYTTTGSNTDSKTGCVKVDNLSEAFEGALGEIMKRTSTFVSPSVAVNSFNRTESLDNAYYAMFLPDESPAWYGNLKKLKIYTGNDTPGCGSNDSYKLGTVVDRGCDAALENGSNLIVDGRSSYWGTVNDGNEVTSGGLGTELLERRGTFYTNIKGDNRESLGELAGIANKHFGDPESFTDEDRGNWINWIKGLDDQGQTRDWVLGDILHSKPVTLNYGDSDGNPDGGSYSRENPDIRIAFGTNYGLLHFIEDQGDQVEENWSFFAAETGGNVKKLYENHDDVPHPYGLDGQISILRLDANLDGNIRKADGDRMILFFGLRRGGDSYYAIDVSIPESPVLLWRIDASSEGFAELGQSWSPPVPMIIPGHRDVDSNKTSINYKFALAFGAGYDAINDDDRSGVALEGSDVKVRKSSTKGRGLFIVDAGTGELIQSFIAPDTIEQSVDNQLESELLKWSVIASPAPMDSNGDGLTDRIYFADTGGNVFRVDIGKVYPDENDNTREEAVWSLIKLAALGVDELTDITFPDAAADRRFMYKPEIVRTTYRGTPYDAVVLGSGNRENPLTETNGDRYYVIRDKNIFYSRFGDCNECVSIPDVLKHKNLFDASDNLIQVGNSNESSDALNKLDNSYGWYINLEAQGEKTSTVGEVYSGQLLFSTYSPSRDPDTNICTPGLGSSRYYVLDLHTASALRDLDGDGNNDDRFSLMSIVGMAGDPTMISLGEGSNLIDLNTGYDGAVNDVGMHRSGWVEE